MTKIATRAAMVAVCFACFGCAVQANSIRFGEHQYAPRPVGSQVDVLLSEPSRPYEVIGLVTADKQAATTIGQVKESDLYPALIEQARLIGADAIVDIQFETFAKSAVFSSRNKHALKASAKAIKYKEEGGQSLNGGAERR